MESIKLTNLLYNCSVDIHLLDLQNVILVTRPYLDNDSESTILLVGLRCFILFYFHGKNISIYTLFWSG